MCINLGTEANGILGGAGACLMVTGLVSTIFSALGLVTGDNRVADSIDWVFNLLTYLGLALYFVAVYGLSKDYKERQIFRPLRNGLLISAVLYFSMLISFGLSSIIFFGYTTVEFSTAVSFVWLILMICNYRTTKLLSEKTGAYILRKSGKLLMLAAILDAAILTVLAVLATTIGPNYVPMALVLSPGIFISYLAWGLTAKGLFALQIPAKPIIQDQTNQRQIQYCPNCGTPTHPNEGYCIKCGGKLQ